jgi:hypothetical protein
MSTPQSDNFKGKRERYADEDRTVKAKQKVKKKVKSEQRGKKDER